MSALHSPYSPGGKLGQSGPVVPEPLPVLPDVVAVDDEPVAEVDAVSVAVLVAVDVPVAVLVPVGSVSVPVPVLDAVPPPPLQAASSAASKTCGKERRREFDWRELRLKRRIARRRYRAPAQLCLRRRSGCARVGWLTFPYVERYR
jgi:hypothetical protein